MKRIPNFFILGAPKCGTTALASYLAEHPAIFMTSPKEPHYFARDYVGDAFPRMTKDEYLRLFEQARPTHRVLGEASTWYIFSQQALEEIARLDADVRAVVLVRNPINFARSLHNEMLNRGDEDRADFEAAWRCQERRAEGLDVPSRCTLPQGLQYGRLAQFGQHVRRARELLGARAVHVVLQEDFSAAPQQTYQEVLLFLDVPYDGRRQFPRVNQSLEHRSFVLGRLLIENQSLLLRSALTIKRRLTDRSFGIVKRIADRNRRKVRRTPLSAPFRRELLDYFASDVADLGAQIGRDLRHWLEQAR